jgi:hypothetical protein
MSGLEKSFLPELRFCLLPINVPVNRPAGPIDMVEDQFHACHGYREASSLAIGQPHVIPLPAIKVVVGD